MDTSVFTALASHAALDRAPGAPLQATASSGAGYARVTGGGGSPAVGQLGVQQQLPGTLQAATGMLPLPGGHAPSASAEGRLQTPQRAAAGAVWAGLAAAVVQDTVRPAAAAMPTLAQTSRQGFQGLSMAGTYDRIPAAVAPQAAAPWQSLIPADAGLQGVHQRVGGERHTEAVATSAAAAMAAAQPTPAATASVLGRSRQIAEQGLPTPIAQGYAERGISSLYDWQADCLATPGVADGKNLVYCAPTSGGKTLVSEVLMLRRISRLQKCAIFVLPYVSIVAEKTRYLQALCRRTPLVVKGFYGGSNHGIREPFDLAVCTIEKANALVNRLSEDGLLGENLVCFVVDELHLVGDSSRGYLLEVALSKVLHLAKNAQVIGLSATLPNVEAISRWLNAVLYRTSFRPVPLQEYVLVQGDTLLANDGSVVRQLSCEGLSEEAKAADATGMVRAVWEATREGHSVLVFCASKVKCEKMARFLADALPKSPQESVAQHTDGTESVLDKRSKLVEDMNRAPCGIDGTLQHTLTRGICFHHSGLTTEERAHLERSYCEGILSVVCATSTLAAGVNLPARRVVFQSPYMGMAFLDATQYRQMAGRAGRAGQGTLGESIVIASQREQRQVLELVAEALPDVRSQLHGERQGLQRLLLEVLSVTPLHSGEELVKFCESTLMCAQKERGELTGNPLQDYPEIAQCMKWLLDKDMIRLDERIQSYVATPLGRAVCACGVEPQQGLFLWRELGKARPCISLDTDLHICYLVTPPDSSIIVDWPTFSRVLRCLSSAERRVADRVGVRLDLVSQAEYQGGRLGEKVRASEDGRRLQRFYSSIVLWAVLHETPAPMLLERFSIGRGQLQQLQQSAASFTTTIAVFCSKLQWFAIEALILSFRQRFAFGVRQELVPLMEIPGMDCIVARALYEAGFTTPAVICGATTGEVLRVLHKTLPHNVPTAALPDSNATALIEAAKKISKEALKEKRQQAKDARKRLREAASADQPQDASGDKRAKTAPEQHAVRRTQGQANVPVVPSGRSVWSSHQNQTATPAVELLQAVAAAEPLEANPVANPSDAETRHALSQPVPPSSPASRDRVLEEARPAVATASAAIERPPQSHDSRRKSGGIKPVEGYSVNPADARNSSRSSTPPAAGAAGSTHLLMSPQREDRLRRSPTPCRVRQAASQRRLSVGNSSAPPKELSAGLRRLGRQSLTPKDVDAVCGTPQKTTDEFKSYTQLAGRGRRASIGGSVRSDPSASSGPSQRRQQRRPAYQSELALAGSQFVSKEGVGLTVARSPLQVLRENDVPTAVDDLRTSLAKCSFLGLTIATLADGVEAALLTTSDQQAFCLPLFGTEGRAVAGTVSALTGWLQDEKHLCITCAAKELAGTFLRLGIEVRCALAEPRLANWLLDPDQKDTTGFADLARRLGIKILAPSDGGPDMRGPGAAELNVATRGVIRALWPEAFLALPLMATLLHKLHQQGLLESFWLVEMPIAAVLAWMEHFGIACDFRDPYHTQSHILYKIAALEERVRELVGRRVLLSSGEDVGRALFEDLALPLPDGVRFRRKNNGRIAYRSPNDILKRVQPHPVIAMIEEHRKLTHVVRRIDLLQESGEEARADPPCSECRGQKRGAEAAVVPAVPTGLATSSNAARSSQPLLRVRTELLQTGTATGRLSTAQGSVPLLHLENPFEVNEVWRPSVHDELVAAGTAAAQGAAPAGALGSLATEMVGARVFVATAKQPPPQPRLLRGGRIVSIDQATCADALPGESTPLSEYWKKRGWTQYGAANYCSAVRQVVVQRAGGPRITYPADQVWRLAAPVKVAESTPKIFVNPRKALVAEDEYLILSCDYSQLEVRLMAHFSGDARFMEILRADGDVFRHVAAGWLRKPEAEVTAEERCGAKKTTYALLYGSGPTRLAHELSISRQMAAELQANFLREFAGVSAWLESCRAQARIAGYVETIRGRRRYLPALSSRVREERAQAERQAVNTVCQASAADLVKAAMLGIHERLKTLRIHAGGSCKLVARMLLQIHDELLFEVHASRLEEVRKFIIDEMIAAGSELRVPLHVRWKVGKAWGSLE
eukprot:TRINITY_DN66034_c0_g1_i2.p1 TRINITY_DN66034_c0_g1~~TRINITY_DN66034_c0_g1_i2.p1  ORF type:complete len:2071 (-),score=351.10 TRINITY_DN66034_c0_g1_i2:81-6293(-)